MSKKAAVNQIAQVIAFDVGKTVNISDEGSTSFFERAKECLSLILQRKILAESIVDVSLILMGCNDGDSNTVLSGCENICCKFELQPVCFEMLKFVELELKPHGKECDWVTALVVAMEMLRLSDCTNKSIVLISDFAYAVSDDQLQIVVDNIRKLNIEITIIGPNHFSSLIKTYCSEMEPAAKRQKLLKSSHPENKASVELLFNMWQTLGSQMQVATFDLALRRLTVSDPLPVRKTPWNCVMDIGDIEIAITGLLKVKRGAKKPSKTFIQKAYVPQESGENKNGRNEDAMETQPTTSTTVGVVKDQTLAYVSVDPTTGLSERIAIEADEVIKGYRYGSTVVPLTEADQAAFKYAPGPKALSVLGFTKKEFVNWTHLYGDGCHVIVPRECDPDSQKALSALIHALNDSGSVAIARKVYSNDRGLKMVLLSPVLNDIMDESGNVVAQKECLAMNEIPFKEDVKNLEFNSLKYDLTEEQITSIDSLIDNMDLMTADVDELGEPCEAFAISTTREFKNRWHQYCELQRALYPGKPLPDQVPERVKESYRIPETIREKHRDAMSTIHKMFEITDEEVKTGVSRFKKNTGWTLTVPEVEVKPITDFPKPEKNESDLPEVVDIKILFSDCCYPPVAAIMRVIKINASSPGTDTASLFDCFSECIAKRRAFSVKMDPKGYNQWITELRFGAPDFGPIRTFIDDVVKVKYGLITESENKEGGVSEEEAKQFTTSTILNNEEDDPFFAYQFAGSQAKDTDFTSQQEREVFDNFF